MAPSPVGEPLSTPRFAQAYRACPLCSADEVEYEFVVDGVAFSRCRACTLLFANPTPAAPSAPSGGLGDVEAELRAFAARVLGREPATVLVVDAAGNVPAGLRYDLVIAAGTIEHAEHPVEHALRLRACVAEDGVLLVTTPSAVSDEALAQRDAWPAFRTKAAWYFTTDTLQLALTRAGFGAFVPLNDARDCATVPSPALRRFFGSRIAMFARPVAPAPGRRLSVIVPVFNEAGTVAELLDTVLAKAIDGIELEVVIVESNSTDGSRAIVERYRSHPRVTLVLEERPRGKGYAVRTGLKHATGEVVLFQDADLEYDVNDYDRLVEPLFALRRNFVLGSRHGASGEGWKIRQFEQRPTVSAVMNLAHLALLTMFNRIYRQTLFDPFTMYKVFRRDCLTGLTFECNRFDFDFEINIKLIRKGYRPSEILVNYTSRSFGEGKKVSFFRDPPTWIRAMLHLRRVPLYTFDN